MAMTQARAGDGATTQRECSEDILTWQRSRTRRETAAGAAVARFIGTGSTVPALFSWAVAITLAWSSASAMPPGDGGSVARAGPSPIALARPIGRFDARDPAGPRFGWPATGIEAAFTGVGVDVRLRDEGANVFAVAIDGATPTTLATNRTTERYVLARGLGPGHHTVLLTKRTESNVGIVQFLGFVPQEGVLLKTPEPARTRRIEFVGDSVTCGYGDLAKGPKEHFSAATEDEASAYGALTAAAFGAQRSVISYSGIGVYRDHDGSTRDQMPVRFRRILADDPTSQWGFRGPAPDAVVVHLGVNDFAKGDPGAAFEQAYVGLLRMLRTVYPHAAIVCAVSPMLTDAYPPGAKNRTKAAGYIRAAVDQRRLAGDSHVFYFAFDEIVKADGFGADYHPSLASHRRMAAALVAVLRSTLGW
jgi:lysophospholipase L1-like esterase